MVPGWVYGGGNPVLGCLVRAGLVAITGQIIKCRRETTGVRWTAPRLLSSFCFSMAQPVEITTNPPPTCTTGRESPKNDSTWEPIVKDATNKIKLLIAMRRASSLRVCALYSFVSERKIGLPPIGSTIGNSALMTSRTLLAASGSDPVLSDHLAGTVCGAPFCFTKNTRNFAGLVVLALRETVWTSSGDS